MRWTISRASPSPHQLRREFAGDDGDHAVVLGRREAFALASVHEQLLGQQRLARDLDIAPLPDRPRDGGQVGFRHRRQRLRYVLYTAAVLLPQQLQVGLHLEAQEVRLVANDADRLHVQFFEHLRREALERLLLPC